MRIVCPRCVAQYEVDETAIPETGREVQCANCENIWFQDFIEMLPDRPAETAAEPEETGVFDDLEGRGEATFSSARRNLPAKDADDEDYDAFEHDPIENLLDDSDDPDALDDEDDAPNPDVTPPPLDDDVLDVLRSEAAFSSARAKIDAATEKALDGDGATRKMLHEDPALDQSDDPQDAINDLDAFLNAHIEEDVQESEEEEIAPEATNETNEEPPTRDVFDPLADLDAIRSQLANIDDDETGDDDTTEPEVAYTPNLPSDDPLPAQHPDDIDTSEDEDDPAQDDETPPEDTFDPDALTAAIAAATEPKAPDMPEDEVLDDPDDDFEDDFDDEDRPRRAYRADGGSSEPESDDEPELQEEYEPEPAEVEPIPAAAPALAAGLVRPRAKGGRARARSLAGFQAPQPDDHLAPEPQAEPVAPEDLPEREPDHSRRPKKDRAQNRKALLPDVEELDASLRSEADQPRRRDQEMMEAHDKELKRAASGGFRRAFIWTVFIIALCLALYVLRPQIVAMVPAAALVLDPYAAVIDSIRLMLDGLFGG